MIPDSGRWSLVFLLTMLLLTRGGRVLIRAFAAWIATRRWWRMAAALPAIAVVVGAVLAVSQARTPDHRIQMAEHYRNLARQAVLHGDAKTARIGFRRAVMHAADRRDVRLEFARAMESLGAMDEATQLLSSLAPADRGGYVPAHRFILSRINGDSRRSDLLRAIHLQHIVRRVPAADSRDDRRQLADIYIRYERFDQAAEVLEPVVHDSPTDRLTLARCLAKTGRNSTAREQTRAAATELSHRLAREPHDVNTRVALAQAHVFLAEFANAITCLVEGLGCSPEDHAARKQLVAASVSTYSAWLLTMSEPQRASQLRSLRLLDDPAVESGSEELGDLLKRRLLAADHHATVSLLLGSALAEQGELVRAENLLRSAIHSHPGNSVARNNLAWVLLQSAIRNTTGVPEADPQSSDAVDREQRLQAALIEAEYAVDHAPAVAEFRQTRGRIFRVLGRLDSAAGDFIQSIQNGLDSAEMRDSLADVFLKLGRVADFEQQRAIASRMREAELQSRDKVAPGKLQRGHSPVKGD